VEPYATIPELLAARVRAARGAPGPWLFFEDRSWTLADVDGEVDRYACGLAERGVGHGDRVAILLGNRPEAIFAWLAANRLGAIAALLNPAYKAPELTAFFALTAPRVVVVSAEHRASAGAAPLLVAPEDLALAGTGAPRAEVRPDDVAVLLATSGTTGAPKAVMQTHRTYALTAEAFPWWVGLGPSDRVLCALPLFHVNAQAYSTMGALGAGAGLVLGPRFSASRFWEDAKTCGATEVNVVGAMVHILLKTPPGPFDRDHGVRVVYAGLALPEAQHRAFEERFGVSMTVGYGLSETTFGTVWPRGMPPKYGAMGTLRQHPRLGAINHARVVRDDGRDANDGEDGELWLMSPATMRGYWADARATGEATTADGWFKTGDIVRRDPDGWFTFVARKKEVIRRRGENVSAAEIEAVLSAHPSVREAAAVGVPSELGEDEIVAFIVPQPGASIDVDDLRAFCRARLADFKVPGTIHVRDTFPRTPTERIAKHLLR
jgi:crotonobetaine/carnitine-CoA ligase